MNKLFEILEWMGSVAFGIIGGIVWWCFIMSCFMLLLVNLWVLISGQGQFVFLSAFTCWFE
jgi:hypothetical protein